MAHWGPYNSAENKHNIDLESNILEEDWRNRILGKSTIRNFLFNEDITCVIVGLRFYVYAIKKGIIK